VQILHGKRLTDGSEGASLRAELEEDYARSYCTPDVAAARGFVDEVIEPTDTRRVLADAIRLLATKRDRHPRRRHSNTPL
jgi:acetyl-CoA carboxylase carboxyltransferase component